MAGDAQRVPPHLRARADGGGRGHLRRHGNRRRGRRKPRGSVAPGAMAGAAGRRLLGDVLAPKRRGIRWRRSPRQRDAHHRRALAGDHRSRDPLGAHTAHGVRQVHGVGRSRTRTRPHAEGDESRRQPARVGRWAQTAVRPRTSARGPRGEAAEIVREQWERLRAAGHLDNPVLEHERVPVRWHLGTMAGGAVLVALGVVGLMA